MITYKAILTYFEAITDAHQQINSFTYGEADLYDKDKFTKYPALHLTPTGTAIDDQTIVYGFDVIVYDRYDVASNKMRNEATSLSNTLLILQDICKEITEGKYFINEDTLISMDMPVICQPFIDTEPDNCSGWFTSFQVITPNEATACNIPYYITERWNNVKVTLPENVRTEDVNWYTALDIGNKATIIGGQVTQLEPFYDTITGDDDLTLTGSSVTYDLAKNSFHFKDTSFSSLCYLESNNLVGNTWTFFITIKDFSRYAVSSNGASNSNKIMSFLSGSGTLDVGISKDNGNVTFTRVGGLTKQTDYPICPTNGDSYETAHRRYEPITLAFQFEETATNIIMYTSSHTSNSVKQLTDGMALDGAKFTIGTRLSTTELCDFYLKEFYAVQDVLTSEQIIDTMQWLNFR